MEFSAGQIAAVLGGKLMGDANVMVRDVAPIESAQSHHLSFITDEKYLPMLETTHAGVVLVTQSLLDSHQSPETKLIAPLRQRITNHQCDSLSIVSAMEQ